MLRQSPYCLQALACTSNRSVCTPFPFPPQTWWLLNLFLVSFDKLPCLHRDIPLTQPLVIVYTASHQSWSALSDFHSNIHSASEVAHPKWLDRSSLFFPSAAALFPPRWHFYPYWHHFLNSIKIVCWANIQIIYFACFFFFCVCLMRIISGNEQYLFFWHLLHFGLCMMGLLIPIDADAVMGHSVSKSIKKISTCFAGCCLFMLLNYLNSIWSF